MNSLYIEGINAPNEIKSQLLALSQDISFEREVTKGGNGYIFFGKNRILGTRVAVKFYYWGGEERFHAEPSILAKINSLNVLPVQNAGVTSGNEWAYFVTPYCSKGDMDDFIERTQLGNLKAVELTCQLLLGIGALHEKRYLHRDLKPANIYLSDDEQSIIGDFGSIKYMPEGMNSIPASSHSVLYRPPESIKTNSYGFLGDIYQAGIILYQLLGGYLPYDEVSWLSKSELKHYNGLPTDADRSIFADQCVKRKIKNGKILDLSSLPPWVPDQLKRAIKKATHKTESKRFISVSAFHIHLNNLKPKINNWVLESGIPTVRANPSYRICEDGGILYVQKARSEENWRKDNSFIASSKNELVNEINERIKA